jgi:hypothetical protein
MKRSRDDVLFWVGIALWSAVMVATWPRALSFGDEVGYVGRAKLLLAGRLHYVPGSVGVWIPTTHGLIGKFPLLFSALLAPLFAVTPRAVFALPIAAAVLLAVTARAALKSWGKSPLWALLVLAHPTIVVMSRTAMADVPQAAAAVAAWWACKRGRAAVTIAWLVILMGLKPTGNVLAFAIVAGEALSSQAALRARDAAAWRRLGAGIAGGVLGFAFSLLENRVANGTFGSGYDVVFEQIKPFSLTYLQARVPTHLVTVLLVPPLLLGGAWTFWRRRDFGPLFVTGGYLAMMCVYFFSDTGTSRLETLALSPRLILPVVAFLLVGYGAWLEELIASLGRSRPLDARPAGAPRWLVLALGALPLASAATISARHRSYQLAMDYVREIATAVTDAHGERMLGLTPNACKAGLMHKGPTTLFDPVSNRTAVVFCSEVSASHRANEPATSCVFPGYHTVTAREGYYALARDDAGGDAL